MGKHCSNGDGAGVDLPLKTYHDLWQRHQPAGEKVGLSDKLFTFPPSTARSLSAYDCTGTLAKVFYHNLRKGEPSSQNEAMAVARSA